MGQDQVAALANVDWKTAAAVVGVIVSTALGILQFVKWRQERPQLKVSAHLVYNTASESDVDTAKGTVIPDDRMGYKEVLIEVGVANHGQKSIQVVAVLIEEVSEQNIRAVQVYPEQLPAVLDPLTSVTMTIQKEFIDMSEQPIKMSVLDALGKKHFVPEPELQNLTSTSKALPNRVRLFQRRDDPNAPPVRAFQMRDRTVTTTRPRNGSRS